MSRRPRRHPGLWWLIIGGIIAAYFLFMLMTVFPQALNSPGGDGLGYIIMGLYLYAIAATGLLITGTVLEIRARIRRRAVIQQPS